MFRRSLVSACLGGVLGLASPARAEPAVCLSSFDRAQELKAQRLLLEARGELLTCAAEACPKSVREDCARWLGEWQDAIPSVVVAVTDPNGRDVVDAVVYLDGARWFDGLDGSAREVNPGAHEIEVVHRGARRSMSFVAREGEQRRRVEVAYPPVVAPKPTPHTRPFVVPAASWMLGGLAVAAFGAFAGFGLAGQGRFDDLRATCSPRCDPDEVASAERLLFVADLSLLGGLVATGIATLVLVTANRGASRAHFTQ